jgi:ferric-dicitrate binding protein FerR (iron transport regulator)
MNEEKSFERLCHALLEGNASGVELEQFRQLVRHSAAARKAYEQQVQIHALLTWQQGRAALPAPVVLSPADFQTQPNVIPFPPDRLIPLRRTALAIAAALVMILGFAFWHLSSRDRAGAPVVAQKGVSVEILEVSGLPYQVGQRVSLEKLEVASGSLRFRISSGAVVEMDGPVTMEFVDSMKLRLLRGAVTTDVGAEAKGFVVETANAQVLDLGTRFGVTVGDEGNTDVVVFEGEVEVYRAGRPRTRESRLASLYEGDAARVSRDEKIERLQSLALRGDLLAVRGLNSPASDVIKDVTDNIKKVNVYRCYTIVPGGMTEGAPASLVRFGHRKLGWHSLPDQPFPQELEGADIIGTFQAAANRRSLTDINLELARPCSVYVFYDSRVTPPDWLRRDFRDTGLRLRSGPWRSENIETKGIKPDANDELHIVHSVWRREVAEAGVITLGAPVKRSERQPCAMYGIAVKAIK